MPVSTIWDAATAAASGGSVKIVFPQSLRSGQTAIGTITVPQAQPNSVNPIQWTAYDAGVFADSWYANQSAQPIAITKSLTIVGTGIADGVVTAFFNATLYTAPDVAPPVPPMPAPAPPPPGPFTLANGSFVSGNTTPSSTATIVQGESVTLGTP
jgi:hypothetical protein